MSRASNNSARDARRAPHGAHSMTDGAPGKSTVEEGTVSRARIERLRSSLPGKDSLIDELIDLFVADLPQRLSALAQAVDSIDGPALALQAHALRGSAANFGARRLDELCAGLEEIGERGAFAKASAILERLGRESTQVRDALLALKSNLATPTGAPAPVARSRRA
jgi:HPt (histidine-containing phosphotransfer) domain-containing protein